jgi:hypothetical protein
MREASARPLHSPDTDMTLVKPDEGPMEIDEASEALLALSKRSQPSKAAAKNAQGSREVQVDSPLPSKVLQLSEDIVEVMLSLCNLSRSPSFSFPKTSPTSEQPSTKLIHPDSGFSPSITSRLDESVAPELKSKVQSLLQNFVDTEFPGSNAESGLIQCKDCQRSFSKQCELK